MEKYVLSKSTFIRGLQCRKSLFLYKNFFHQRDPLSKEVEAVFSRGTNVGIMARKLFPGGKDASPSSYKKISESLEKTKKFIEQGEKIIYEATFQFNKILVAVDVLVNDNGVWKVYEVKSSVKISSTYLLDASIQHYVLSGAGIHPHEFYILYMNNEYKKEHQLDLNQLFKKQNVTEDVIKNKEFVEVKVQEFMATLEEPMMPDVQIGLHCFEPYTCHFKGTCWKNVPDNSVFDIGGLPRVKQFELYNNRQVKISEIQQPEALGEWQALQVKSYVSGKKFVDDEKLKSFLSGLYYPLYFMDFETMMPAVPLYYGTHPYEHIPFQYSLHYQDKPGGELKHFQFLGDPNKDPRHDFIKQLLLDTLPKGDIIVFNAQFEKQVLNNLKIAFPELSGLIDERISRIKDLMDPFKNRWYYHPAMKGSYSIKSVLPALVPEMSYDKLAISGGTIAMAAYENLLNETDIFKISETREALLEYCKLDTLAMVKILDVLKSETGN